MGYMKEGGRDMTGVAPKRDMAVRVGRPMKSMDERRAERDMRKMNRPKMRNLPRR